MPERPARVWLFRGDGRLADPALLVAVVAKGEGGDMALRIALEGNVNRDGAVGAEGIEESVGRLCFERSDIAAGRAREKLIALAEVR